jgi:hypothetical protein
MTYTDFKTTVLSFANRDSTLFASGSLDYVLTCMNMARKAAQREYTFTLNRDIAFADLSLAPISMLTGFTATPTTTARVVKQIDAVYEYASAGTVSGATRYYRTNKFPLFRQSVFEQELDYSPTVFGGNTRVVTSATLASSKQFAYIQGVNVYHNTLTTPTSYMFDVVTWLADHDGGASEDIFLTYFSDWLIYATLLNMNAFLKSDQQISVSASFVARLWESVKQFDAQQGAATTALDLD